MHSYVKRVVAGLAAAALTLLPAAPAFADGGHSQTTTPIKHLVIIFQENVSTTISRHIPTHSRTSTSQSISPRPSPALPL